jgi:hypothetical protein
MDDQNILDVIKALREDCKVNAQRGEYESGYLWALDHVEEAVAWHVLAQS